jgi:hypothetical protein
LTRDAQTTGEEVFELLTRNLRESKSLTTPESLEHELWQCEWREEDRVSTKRLLRSFTSSYLRMSFERKQRP